MCIYSYIWHKSQPRNVPLRPSFLYAPGFMARVNPRQPNKGIEGEHD